MLMENQKSFQRYLIPSGIQQIIQWLIETLSIGNVVYFHVLQCQNIPHILQVSIADNLVVITKYIGPSNHAIWNL